MNVDKEMTPTPTTDEIRTAARAWAFAKDKSQGRAVILFEETSSSIRQYIDDMERNTFTMILLAQLMESLERSSAHNTSAEALESYDMPELRYFREHFLGSFQLTLDEME